jgi:hypothetical protein
VLVVLASGRDRVAARVVAEWGAEGGALLTCGDLSCEGWRYRPGAAGRSVAVIEGQRVRAADIEGVLVRLPFVAEDELHHIVPDDRAYVAQEMTAFLTAWLADLRCPVVNRPTAECLGGPGWSPEQWLHVAAGLGLAVRPRRVRLAPGVAVRNGATRSRVVVTVVGKHIFSRGPANAAEQARRLAAAAGVDLLEVHFDANLRCVAVNPWPDVSPPDVADALRDTLRAA